MVRANRAVVYGAALLGAVVVGSTLTLGQQPAAVAPTNDAPNPYQTIEGHFKLPEGRTWGSTSAVDIAPDGRTIWVAERCGSNSCLDRATGQMNQAPSILKFDTSGKLLASFGQGMLIFPHGIHVDAQGNVWVTDGQDNAPAPARGGGAAAGGGAAGGGAPAAGQGAARGPAPVPAPNPAANKGHQVFKFSPEGKLLMTLGKPGGAAGTDYFFQPNDVITNQKGEIFVGEGHSSAPGAVARILKFSPDGKLIKVLGKRGPGNGEFDQPHGARVRFTGPSVRGRPRQQPRADHRSGGQLHRLLAAVQPPERRLRRQERHGLLRRLRVRIGEPRARRLEARHPHRQRQGRQDHRVHPRPAGRSQDRNARGRGRGGRSATATSTARRLVRARCRNTSRSS